MVAVMMHFGWKKIAIVQQNSNLFDQVNRSPGTWSFKSEMKNMRIYCLFIYLFQNDIHNREALWTSQVCELLFTPFPFGKGKSCHRRRHGNQQTNIQTNDKHMLPLLLPSPLLLPAPQPLARVKNNQGVMLMCKWFYDGGPSKTKFGYASQFSS